MLSILIPSYNYNVVPLVSELQKQCIEARIDFEIICQDDASKSSLNIENNKINLLENCFFNENEVNLGFCENRNNLAYKSKFEILLFIDGDSKILVDDYIKKYIDNFNEFEAVYGGRLHPVKCPSNNQKLRWKYGKYTEDKLVDDRIKTLYQSFLFNNAIIKKELFNKIKFDGNMKKYGHDDTQFSYNMMQLNVKINHIDNPVIHNDIDENAFFASKMKESLENLWSLVEDKKIDKSYSKLVSFYEKLKFWKLNFIITKVYLLFEKQVFKNLEGENPSLFMFNFFRIGYFCTIAK